MDQKKVVSYLSLKINVKTMTVQNTDHMLDMLFDAGKFITVM